MIDYDDVIIGLHMRPIGYIAKMRHRIRYDYEKVS
jgi:hypothetical protein